MLKLKLKPRGGRNTIWNSPEINRWIELCRICCVPCTIRAGVGGWNIFPFYCRSLCLVPCHSQFTMGMTEESTTVSRWCFVWHECKVWMIRQVMYLFRFPFTSTQGRGLALIHLISNNSISLLHLCTWHVTKRRWKLCCWIVEGTIIHHPLNLLISSYKCRYNEHQLKPLQ